MIEILPSSQRFHTRIGWLDSLHTFSFGEHHDPRRQGFRALRVINEDRVAPGQGFAPHRHRDMEIISYVLEGRLEHKDSMGTGSVIAPGDVQRMSAGNGVTHSEFNASRDEPVHFLQIWILPEREGLEPGYEQKHFAPEEKRGKLRLVASRDGASGSVRVHQDVSLYAAVLEPGESVAHALAPGRAAWIQVVRGELSALGTTLRSGDGAAVSGERSIELRAPAGAGVDSAGDGTELLLFDLA